MEGTARAAETMVVGARTILALAVVVEEHSSSRSLLPAEPSCRSRPLKAEDRSARLHACINPLHENRAV